MVEPTIRALSVARLTDCSSGAAAEKAVDAHFATTGDVVDIEEKRPGSPRVSCRECLRRGASHPQRLGPRAQLRDTTIRDHLRYTREPNAISIDCFSLQSLTCGKLAAHSRARTLDAFAFMQMDRAACVRITRSGSRPTPQGHAPRATDACFDRTRTGRKKICKREKKFQKNSAPEVRKTKNRASRSRI